MREKLRRFMVGRYGVDELNRFLLVLTMILVGMNLFVRSFVLYAAGTASLILCYARMLSKNISRRFQENQKYLHYEFLVKERLKKWKYQLEQRKKYHIYKCPNCKQKIRIPRGWGKVSIHCPKCNTDFIRRS